MTTETQTAPTHGPKVPDRGGYVPIAALWTAAVDAIAAFDASADPNLTPAGRWFGLTEKMEALREAVQKITAARDDAKALSNITDEASGYRLGDDGDVDIIGDWTHHNGSPAGGGGGYWVDAWVWVEDPAPDYKSIATAAGFIVESNLKVDADDIDGFTWLRADRSDEAATQTREQYDTEEEAWEACCEANDL